MSLSEIPSPYSTGRRTRLAVGLRGTAAPSVLLLEVFHQRSSGAVSPKDRRAAVGRA